MASNFRFLLILLSSTIIIIFILIPTWLIPQHSLSFNSVNERSELFWDKFRLLKGNLDFLKSNAEIVKEPNGDELIYCDEDFEEEFGKEKVFSNRNLFDQLTRKLEDEVLSIMTSTSPCSTTTSTSSPSLSTTPSRSKSSTRQGVTSTMFAGRSNTLPGNGKDLVMLLL